MGRDYGQRRAGGRQARQQGELPGWAWLIVGLAFGLAIAAFTYITRPVEPPAAVRADAPASTDSEAPKNIELPPKQQARFSFYEILPSYEVVIPREERREGPKPKPLAEPGSYVIQVGSFRDRKDAEQQRASLALLGIESRVEQVTIDNNQTWFRVRIGPEKDVGRVHMIMAQLTENNLDSLLLRVQN